MKRFFQAIVFCMVLLFCSGCGNGSPTRWQYVDTAMGTVIQQNIYSSHEETAQSVSHGVMELLKQLEQERISWRLETSELYRLNASAGSTEGVALSEDLAVILGQCLDVTEKSQGAFDVTIGAVARLWDIDSYAAGEGEGDFKVPDEKALEQALQVSGSGKLLFDNAADGENAGKGMGYQQAVLYLPTGMQLDLGAVGKGLALSEIQKLLKNQPDISGAVISAGGSILTYGTKPDGSSWKVAVINPSDTKGNIGVLSLQGDWFVATSGDYERYVEVDGVRYHHILNPQTGYPANSGVRSVTILCRDGLLSDALSTACFILGAENGLELAAQYEAEALFVLENGEIVMSEGMEQYFQESR